MYNRTANDADKKFPNMALSSRPQWSSRNNPRVVRVSRNFGGKDRHTKVTTMRGVRDRRIRLSASTAIQLYDLQERLGLRQPSKVVEWLIDVAKNNIDDLPPLPVLMSQPTTTFGNIIADQDHGHHLQFSEVPLNMLPYNNFNSIWDPPNLSLSQFGGEFPFMPQTYDEEKSQSLSTTTPTNPQLHSCPSANTAGSPSIFPPLFFSHNGTPSTEMNDHSRQFNFFDD